MQKIDALLYFLPTVTRKIKVMIVFDKFENIVMSISVAVRIKLFLYQRTHLHV